MRIAVLGPGGVGGFVAGALARSGEDVTVVARAATAARIDRHGLRVESVRLGAFVVDPPAAATLPAPVDVLVVAVKAPSLDAALERVPDPSAAALVVPLLNGVEHLDRLRAVFGERAVAATIRIAAERVEPGRIVQTSPLFRIELVPTPPTADLVERFAHALRAAEIPVSLRDSEADVLWSKLARLAALALTTAASGATIGEVRTHPRWRVLLQEAVDEVVAVGTAEGARELRAGAVLAELADAPAGQTSSLARDVAAGHEGELDAIGGAVLRAAARHGIACAAVEELLSRVRERLT